MDEKQEVSDNIGVEKTSMALQHVMELDEICLVRSPILYMTQIYHLIKFKNKNKKPINQAPSNFH